MALTLVMITQVVDEEDPVLGFTCGWIRTLAKHVEKLEVICLREGKHDISGNVSISVMPVGKLRRFLYLKRYLKKGLSENRIDAVLAHMCPIYAVVAGSVLRGRIPVGLWYVHSSITWKLKCAVKRSQVVFTCAEKGSISIKTDKLVITGHGIDTEKFRLAPSRNRTREFRIISVGRISPLKRYHTLIPALGVLNKELSSDKIEYHIYGPKAGGSYRSYAEELLRAAEEAGLSEVLILKGPVSYLHINQVYHEADLLVNMTPHVYDKVVLEACACGVPVFTTNKDYRDLFGKHADMLIADTGDPHKIAAKLEGLLKMDPEQRDELGGFLRQQVLNSHSLDGLMKRIVDTFESII